MPIKINQWLKAYAHRIAVHLIRIRARLAGSPNISSSDARKSGQLSNQNSAEAILGRSSKKTKTSDETPIVHLNPKQKTIGEAFKSPNDAHRDTAESREVREPSTTDCNKPASTELTPPESTSARGFYSAQRDQPSIITEIEMQKPEVPAETQIQEKTKELKLKNPRAIGGRRRKRASQAMFDHGPKTTIRPELQCRKTSMGDTWEIAISVNSDCQVESVLHDEQPLQLMNGTCSLQSFRGQVSVILQNGENNSVTLFDGNPLVFKLPKNWSGIGRAVKGITSGHYIVFTPIGWTRTGLVPVEPDACTDDGFTAHYFYVDAIQGMTEFEGFKEFEGQLRVAALELTGERIFDDSEDGDLFVGEVPSLPKSSDYIWARVGSEELDGWTGENFEPSKCSLASALCGREGRFYIRVYGKERMLDSTQFRYLRDLKEILLNGEPYARGALLMPSPIGHDRAEVRFVGISARIHVGLLSPATHTEVRGSSLYISPHPDGDRISCTLESDVGSVRIELKLPRVWWRLERNSKEQPKWNHTPINMTRDEFSRRIGAGWFIRMRLPKHVKSARVGFCGQRKSTYLFGSNCDTVRLDDFVDNEVVTELHYADVSFEAEIGMMTLTLIRISADPTPTIILFSKKPKHICEGEKARLSWETRNAEPRGVLIEPEIGVVEHEGTLDIAPKRTTTYTLRLTAQGIDDVMTSVTIFVRPRLHTADPLCALVRSTRGGWRIGKGFSPCELRDAGLESDAATRHLLCVDERRRTTHLINVESLRGLTDA